MRKARRYNIDGLLIDIPLLYDESCGKYMEIYPDFIENPVYTPEGYPIMFTGEDACDCAEPADGEVCLDCGSCVFYRQTENTLIGVCRHEKKQQS